MSEQAQQGSGVVDAVTKQLQQAQGTGEQGVGNIAGLDLGSLMGSMSTTVIVINVVAGIVGTYYFLYGRKKSNIPMIVCGVLLCVVPIFIANVYGLTIICLILFAAPFFVERYSLFQ
ncbi:MAG: hypothetical protein WCP33_02255 [Deltaproteobacteria bacterium]